MNRLLLQKLQSRALPLLYRHFLGKHSQAPRGVSAGVAATEATMELLADSLQIAADTLDVVLDVIGLGRRTVSVGLCLGLQLLHLEPIAFFTIGNLKQPLLGELFLCPSLNWLLLADFLMGSHVDLFTDWELL